MVLDIQRDARANMISYRRTAAEQLKAMKPLVEQKKVETALESLVKMFQYYKLSLFSYSLASMLEILLSGNYKEGYISDKSSELEQYVVDYRELFSECSMYLESLSDASLQQKILKGVGFAGKAVGKAIGAIPVIKNGPVDEFLIEKGTRIAENAESMKEKTIRSFARLSDPNVRMFIAKMDDMVRIFNHTSEILFDDKQMYLIAA